jgi:hypothetical protein
MANENRRTRTETVEHDRREAETPPVAGDLVTTGDGVLSPSAKMADFINLGFSETATLKIGDPANGDAVLAYAGEFIGPGPDIELNEALSKDNETKTIPTWLFHPLDVSDLKNIKTIRAITHKLICPTNLDGICKELAAVQQANPGKRVQASIMWTGVGKNRIGQPLNKYRSSKRVVNPDGSPTEAATPLSSAAPDAKPAA